MGEINKILRKGEDWQQNKLDNCGYCFGGKGDSPDPPDYKGAAIETAQGNLDAARFAAKANRVNQYTPYGNLVYSQGQGLNQGAYDQAVAKYQDQLSKWNAAGGDSQQQMLGGRTLTYEDIMSGNYSKGQTVGQYANPNFVARPESPNQQDFMTGDPDSWSATVQLSPEQQQLLDQQNKVSLGLANLSNRGLGYVEDMLSSPFDTSRLPAEQINAGQTAQDAIMARLNPMFSQREEQLRARMANQGIGLGTEAWNNEMRGFEQGRNDAYMQSALQGMNIGQQARQQSLQEQAFLRNEPLNTLNAVRTGAQVTNPTFTNVPQQQTTSGPDLMGAAQQSYNAQAEAASAENAQQGQMTSGLMSLAATAAMAF